MAIRPPTTIGADDVVTASLALDVEQRAAQMAFDVETVLDELERLRRDVRELRSALIEQRIVLDELRNEEGWSR